MKLVEPLRELFKDEVRVPEKVFGAPMKSGSVAVEVSPELLGVGYIIGPRIASIMCAGGVLTYLVLIPLIKFFGDGLTTPLAPGCGTDQCSGSWPDSRRVCAVHRRRCRSRRRGHQSVSSVADDLTWFETGTAGLPREGRCAIDTAHAERHSVEVGRHRRRGADGGDYAGTVAARQPDRCVPDRIVRLSIRDGVVSPHR